MDSGRVSFLPLSLMPEGRLQEISLPTYRGGLGRGKGRNLLLRSCVCLVGGATLATGLADLKTRLAVPYWLLPLPAGQEDIRVAATVSFSAGQQFLDDGSLWFLCRLVAEGRDDERKAWRAAFAEEGEELNISARWAQQNAEGGGSAYTALLFICHLTTEANAGGRLLCNFSFLSKPALGGFS